MTKEIVARLKKHGLKFEILVDSEKYIKYKEGQLEDIADIFIGDSIFSDIRAAERAKESDLQKVFGTTNFLEIARKIVEEGEVQITAEERAKLIEQKRRRIVDMISKRCIDPQTGKPHPVQRIELAMEQARIKIDPFKNVEEQYRKVVDELKKLLPLAVEMRDYVLRIPVQYAGKARGIITDMATLKKEEWSSNYWFVEIELLAALEDELFSRLNALTHGSLESKLLRKG